MIILHTKDIEDLKLTSKNERLVKLFLQEFYRGDEVITCTTKAGKVLDVLSLDELFNNN